MNNFVKNWKTTLAGAIVVMIGIIIYITKSDAATAISLVTIGAGLISAKDQGASDGQN